LAAEEFAVRAGAAALNQVVDAVGLFRVLLLAADEHVHLAPPRRQRAQAPADAEQQQLSHVAEVEAHAAAIRPTILPNLVPDNIGLVTKTPGTHDFETLRQQRVGAPKVEVALRRRDSGDRQAGDLLEG